MSSPKSIPSHVEKPEARMPLKCLINRKEIYAFNFLAENAWAALRKENSQQRHLNMACCGANVTLKTSKLGTRYFAHSRVGNCTTKPESKEHLLAKTIVAQSAIEAGWTAYSEYSGRSGLGAEWIADVLARKEGMKPVAFEIQWSRQTELETRARQIRYAASDVRGLWLFKQHDFPIDRNIPAFRLMLDAETNEFSVALPSPHLHERVNRKDSGSSELWQQIIPLPFFITGALEGRLKFAPALNVSVPMEIWASTKYCWSCGCETKIINFLDLKLSKRFHGHADARLTIYDFDHIPDGAKILRRLVPASFLDQHNIGDVKLRRYGGLAATISNGCTHCDAVHGFGHDFDDIENIHVAASISVRLNPIWIDHIDTITEAINRWWFDTDLTAGRAHS